MLGKYTAKSQTRSLWYAFAITFFCSLIFVIIHSIINGIYHSTIQNVKRAYHDIRITIPACTLEEYQAISACLNTIPEVICCAPLGIHYGLLNDNNNLKPSIFFIIDIDCLYDFIPSTVKIQNVVGNRVLCGKDIIENDQLLERMTVITSNSTYSAKSNSIICNPLSLIPLQIIANNDLSNVIIMNHKAWYNITEVLPFSKIVLSLDASYQSKKDYMRIMHNIAQKLSLSLDSIIPWYQAHEEVCSVLALEYWSSIIVCSLLFVLIIIVTMTLIILFFNAQRCSLAACYLLGMPMRYIIISSVLFIDIILCIASLMGGALGYAISYILGVYQCIQVSFYDWIIIIPFIPYGYVIGLITIVTLLGATIITYYASNNIALYIRDEIN